MSFTCHLCVKQGKSGLGHAPGPNCPEVQNYICGFCKEKGHSTRHCPIILERENAKKYRRPEFKKPNVENKLPVKRVEKIVNHFGIIENDSEMPKKPVVATKKPVAATKKPVAATALTKYPTKAATAWSNFTKKTEPDVLSDDQEDCGNPRKQPSTSWADDDNKMDLNDPFFK